MYFIQTFNLYSFFKLTELLKLLSQKMSQNLQQQTQKQAEKAESCINVQNGKKIKHNRLNGFKSQSKPESKNCQNFVVLNKRKTFEKFGGAILEYVKEFGSKGFFLLLF